MNHQDELPLAKVSEVDEAKRQWLQGMRHPVDTVTEPEPAEILAEFIRQHSAAGQLVARAVFLSPPYSVAEEELSVLLESIKQNGDYADIACMTGSQDDYYYSTQAMSENYAVRRRTKNTKTFHEKCENLNFRTSSETVALFAVFLFI